MSPDETNSPLGRPHHGDSYEIPPIVNEAMLDPAARRRCQDQLRRLAERRDISRATYLVGIALVELSRVTGAVFPTLATLARRAFCKVKTVQRAISRLRELGLLTWYRRITRLPDGRGVQTSSTYILHPPPEAKAAPTAAPVEQNRPSEPLRFLRVIGNKLETGFMNAMSTGTRVAALEAAQRALQRARERPQLRLAPQAGRR